jgi:hypothetical protein
MIPIVTNSRLFTSGGSMAMTMTIVALLGAVSSSGATSSGATSGGATSTELWWCAACKHLIYGELINELATRTQCLPEHVW